MTSHAVFLLILTFSSVGHTLTIHAMQHIPSITSLIRLKEKKSAHTPIQSIAQSTANSTKQNRSMSLTMPVCKAPQKTAGKTIEQEAEEKAWQKTLLSDDLTPEQIAHARYWDAFFQEADKICLASKQIKSDPNTVKTKIMDTCKTLLQQNFPNEPRLQNEILLHQSAEYEYSTFIETKTNIERERIRNSLKVRILAALNGLFKKKRK